MQATAPLRSYRVLRRAKLLDRQYEPGSGEPQYFHAPPDFPDRTLQSLRRSGLIVEDFSAEARADAEETAKAREKAAQAREKAARDNPRDQARASRAARDRRRSETLRIDASTPQRQRAEEAERNRKEAEESEGNPDGSSPPAKPGESGATSEEPVTGDDLLTAPGSGLPSDDPGRGAGNQRDPADAEPDEDGNTGNPPAHDVNQDPPAEGTNNPQADDDTGTDDFEPSIEPSKGLPSDDPGKPPVRPDFTTRAGAGTGTATPPPDEDADTGEATTKPTAAKGTSGGGKRAQSSRLPSDAEPL